MKYFVEVESAPLTTVRLRVTSEIMIRKDKR